MSRYTSTFSQLKKENKLGFCPFAVLGAPTEQECIERIQSYLDHGATMLELGIPFSDPVADGPVVAHADEQALNNGMTLKKCFSLLRTIRSMTHIPIGLLCYANSVHSQGIEHFFEQCKTADVDSVLIADCPLEEIQPFLTAARAHGIELVYIVSENTTAERLTKIEKIKPAFLYVVSTLGVTGARKELNPALVPTLTFLSQHTSLPTAVGFGISTPEHISQLKGKTNAAIVGSFFVGSNLESLPQKIDSLSKLC